MVISFSLNRWRTAFLLFCLATRWGCAEEMSAPKPESLLGWIPMQRVTAGDQLLLDLRRFYFEAPGSNEQLVISDSVPGKFLIAMDTTSRTLAVNVSKHTAGLLEIPLQIQRITHQTRDLTQVGRKDMTLGATTTRETRTVLHEGVLVIAVQPADGYTFTYHAIGESPHNVSVTGSFNQWNPTSHKLWPISENTFQLFVRLPPGPHFYKFIVDGQQIPDPENPEQADDGKGGKNAIARVGTWDRGRAPVVYAESANNEQMAFRLIPGDSNIVQISTVLQLPGGDSRIVQHHREENIVTVDTTAMPEGSWIRLAAADALGNVSKVARAPVRPFTDFQWQDAIVYHVLTDRFADGEPSNNRPVDDTRVLPSLNFQGGDFQGIRKKMEEGYFSSLGINVLELAPIFRNPEGAWQSYLSSSRFSTGYHGAWPISMQDVDERFGGSAAFKELVQAAHAGGMRVITGNVIKHVHQEHPLWKEQPEFFTSLELGDGKKNLRLSKDNPWTTWSEKWLPRWDVNNPEVTQYLLKHATQVAEQFDLDGYLFNAAQDIEHSFWWRYGAAIRMLINPKRRVPFYSVGKTLLNRQDIVSYVGSNMLNGQFDFPLYKTIISVFAKQDLGMEILNQSLVASEWIYGKETPMAPFVGGEETGRFMAFADGDLPDPAEPNEEEVGWKKPPSVDNITSYEKLKLALTFLLSIDGVPTIYYGDEIGMTGAGAPDNQRMMLWDEKVTDEQNAVREHFRKVAAVRHQHPALRYGSRRALVAEGDRYAFVRAHLGDTVLAVWNRGKFQTEFRLTVAPEMRDGVYLDALSGNTMEVKNGRTSFKIPPMTSALFVVKEN